MPGLAWRLHKENLADRVTIIHADLAEIELPPAYLVITSGALQYSVNLRHAMADMVGKVQAAVAPGGLLYIDYMLPMEERYIGRDNYPSRERWQEYFDESKWEVAYNRVLQPQFEAAHVDLPVDHYHHWGHLLAKRHAA